MISSYFLQICTASFLAAGLGSQPQHRIIGGTDIVIEEAPWQVSLQVNGEHHCGGSLYSDRIVITAAHCFYQTLDRLWHTKELLVLAGSEVKRSRQYLVAVSAKKHHEKFRWYRLAHDIGIMKLFKPFLISRKIKPIHLALKNPAPGSKVLSTGWGQINSRDPQIPDIFPENLQGVYIYIVSVDVCEKSMPWIEEHTICAGTAGRSPCSGDSGGPLVFNNTLVGVVSGGTEECIGPGVYTSVAHHHKWLVKAIKSISNKKVRSGNRKIRMAHNMS